MTASANAALPKEPFSVSMRRFVLFLVALCMAYLLIWVPWRSEGANLLIFVGFGMIQVAAIYTQGLRERPTAFIDGPLLFLNPFTSVFVTIVALIGFIIELKVGFGVKPWWEALLLPIPPFIIAGVWYKNRNPAPPFFTGVVALVLAVSIKFLT